MSRRVLVAFSGGLDSTASAVLHQRDGHEVVLHHTEWMPASRFGAGQERAAAAIARELGLPLVSEVGVGGRGAYLWVPITWTLAITYAWRRGFDAVSLGSNRHGQHYDWLEHAHLCATTLGYQGQILTPVLETPRADLWSVLPSEVRPLVWACNRTRVGGRRCGQCSKCVADAAAAEPVAG